MGKGVSKRTEARILLVNRTTKTCKRMYSHIATTMPPPPVGVQSGPAGHPDGINNRFYAAIPTYVIDLFGIWIIRTINFSVFGSVGEKIITGNNKFNGVAYGFCTINFKRKVTDTGDSVFFYSSSINTTVGSITYANQRVELDSSLDEINININMSFIFNKLSSKGYSYFFSITTVSEPTLTQTFWVIEND